MKALVTTTPARAYTIRHPDGRLVAEVLWGDFGGPILTRIKGDSVAVGRVSSWHKACGMAQEWAREEWRLDVGEPEPVPLITVPGLPVDKEAETSIERLRARVAELEARPTVHPLAWDAVRRFAIANNTDEGWGTARTSSDAWMRAGCPLTATGGEVLVPGEEP